MNKPGTICWAAAGCVALGMLAGWATLAPAEDKPSTPEGNPVAVEAPDYSGKYLADGVGNGGRPYKAMVEIRREGEAYNVIWVLSPRETYGGIGLVQGDALSVGWATGETPGVIIYQPDKGKLVGRWTAPGAQGKTFQETLTPVK